MKNPLIFLLFLVLFSCKNDPKQPEETLTVESLSAERSEGNCTNPEAPCAKISLRYPSVKLGNENLQKSVANWANDFLVGMLDPSQEPDSEASLTAAIDGFVEMHREMLAEMPDLPSRYEVEVRDTLLLKNDKHLTLRLDGYSYTGGAHPNSFSAVATFDLPTGRQLRIDEMVPDTATLKTVAEQFFRKTRQDVFADGFDFDQSFPFQIANSVGITSDGLFFCYVPYEVAPYAVGFTEFVIPFAELAKTQNQGAKSNSK